MVLAAALACIALAGCGQSDAENIQQGGSMQYFFSGEVTEAEDACLRIQVNDIGNSSLSDGDSVGVSADVVSAGVCPEFTVGEFAEVLLTHKIENPAVRLEALSIYKVDETGAILIGEAGRENAGLLSDTRAASSRLNGSPPCPRNALPF